MPDGHASMDGRMDQHQMFTADVVGCTKQTGLQAQQLPCTLFLYSHRLNEHLCMAPETTFGCA